MAPTSENVDFYWNLLELHFNVVYQKHGGLGVQQRFQFYRTKIEELAASGNPVEYFAANFMKDYKLAEGHADSVTEETKDKATFEEQVMAVDDGAPEVDIDPIADEDEHVKNPSFRQWLANMSAQNNMLHLILKIAEFVNGTGDPDSDEEFEDCELDQDESGQVIDLDAFQIECCNSLQRWIPFVLDRARTLPHLLGLSR